VASPLYVNFAFISDQFHAHSPDSAKTFFFISVMRNAFVIIILTWAAWLYCRDRAIEVNKKYPIKILLTVPSGLKHIQRPSLDHSLLSALAPQLPVATIILLLEHIAISKCGFAQP